MFEMRWYRYGWHLGPSMLVDQVVRRPMLSRGAAARPPRLPRAARRRQGLGFAHAAQLVQLGHGERDVVHEYVVDEAVGVGKRARLLPDPQRVAEADASNQDTEQVDGPLGDRVVERVPPRAPPHPRESVKARRARI